MNTVSEEQILFNKLNQENQQFILNQMRLLQPCELIEEKKIPEKVEIDFMNEDDTLEDITYMTTINVGRLADKINSIIDYLKSKGDK